MSIAAPENQAPAKPTGLQHRLLPSDHDGSPEVNRYSIPGCRSKMLLVGDQDRAMAVEMAPAREMLLGTPQARYIT